MTITDKRDVVFRQEAANMPHGGMASRTSLRAGCTNWFYIYDEDAYMRNCEEDQNGRTYKYEERCSTNPGNGNSCDNGWLW